MATKLDARQSVLRAALPMVGSLAGDGLDSILQKIDPELSKLFEDRNVLLTDGGIITFTGTQLQFTENLNLLLNSKVAGGAPVVINLGSANVNFPNNLDMWYAVINRTAGTATTTVVINATGLPAVTSANQEVFLLAKRVDAGDGTQRIYWRSGMAMNAGQSVRLGASGSGSGNGTGDDLDALQFRASFNDGFDDGPTSALSAVNATTGFTDSGAYNAAKAMYTLNYDASKTIAAATTTTNINISAVAAFTVKIGDVVVNNGQARRITAVATQASFTTEAFSVAPTLASQVTVSQSVYSKDIYNLALDGNAISAAFPASTFSEIMVDYEDTSTAGDNVFDIDTVPVIAYSASPDNTSFTDVKVRPTNVTDTVLGIILPSAGSALYLRFFANKTSGSGSVNVLRYKAFVQKSLTATSGGVINSAYAFLNGNGTEYNLSLSVVGGKSTITLTNWTYAVGVAAGSPYGSLDVYINGSLIPRFIDSTLTPDASYLETSPSIITLDRDYSNLQFSIEILQRVQIVDNSSSNSSNISVLREIVAQNQEDFVNLSVMLNATANTGAPAAGTFFSSVTNRAQITDLSQNLRARMGINRIHTQQAYQLENEFTATGDQVFGVYNDTFGQLRLVGQWTQNSTSAGPFLSAQSASALAEITFYGTGLNLLYHNDGSARDVRAKVDGGVEGANILTTGNGVLNNLGYPMLVITPVVSGLTLGIHTVTLRMVTSAILVQGFETIVEQSTINVAPGSAYSSGLKLVSAAASNQSPNSTFESGTLGARGGRAIVYLKSDGTVKKAVTPTNGSQQNLTSADHTNEEVARTIWWREFGVARGDDFSTLTSSTSSRAYTLEDNSTTLVGAGVLVGSVVDYLALGGLNNFVEICFVGTGLDLQNSRGASLTDSYTINVDGTAIATNTAGNTLFSSTGTGNVIKIVSGLPYGSHTVRITISTAGGTGINIPKFIVYQPKTPSLPSGAVEVARYNIPATYVANATGGQQTVGTGIIRKNNAKEYYYLGSSWTRSAINTGNIGGFTVSSTNNTDSLKYTFFGTGFEYRFANGGVATTFTIAVDGSTNVSGFTNSSYGPGIASWTPSTGTVVTNATSNSGNGVSISGLSMGLHTITITKTAGSTAFPEAFDIISPVHGYKVGSPSIVGSYDAVAEWIEDTRAFAELAVSSDSQKAWAQAFITTNGPTTSSTTAIPVPDLLLTLKVKGGPVEVFYSMASVNSGANENRFQLWVDGAQVGTQRSTQGTSINTCSDSVILNLAPGVHTFVVMWFVGAGTATGLGVSRTIKVREL